jgi:hypothetical protein
VDDKPSIISEPEPEDYEAQLFAEYNERFLPYAYRPVFYSPASGVWHVGALYLEGFFEASKLLLQGTVNGSLNQCIEGFPAVFLCRHYLEIALKYALFHSRWLRDANHNATIAAIDPVGKNFGHDLRKLWNALTTELKNKRIDMVATGLDLDFVGKFVAEFDSVDKHNVRFRYAGEQLPAGPSNETLNIDFPPLLFNLERSHEILITLDSYLVETYGQNEEWEEIQNSW